MGVADVMSQEPAIFGSPRACTYSLLDAVLLNEDTKRAFVLSLERWELHRFRQASKDARSIVDDVLATPLKLREDRLWDPASTWWSDRVMQGLRSSTRWPARREVLLSIEKDHTDDLQLVLLPLTRAAKDGLALPRIDKLTIRMRRNAYRVSEMLSRCCCLRNDIYSARLTQRQDALRNCNGPFDPDTGDCSGCASCNDHRFASPQQEAEWMQAVWEAAGEQALTEFVPTIRWHIPSGQLGLDISTLFPNLMTLDLSGDAWLPPHSGMETNTPALQARWSALLSALRPHRLPRLRSLAGPAHLLLHPALAELTGLQHLAIRFIDTFPRELPAHLRQLPKLHTLTLQQVTRPNVRSLPAAVGVPDPFPPISRAASLDLVPYVPAHACKVVFLMYRPEAALKVEVVLREGLVYVFRKGAGKEGEEVCWEGEQPVEEARLAQYGLLAARGRQG